MAKYKTEPTPEVDSGMVEIGDTVMFWDDRKQKQRAGTIEKITSKCFHVRCLRSIRKILLNDESFYLWQDGKMRLIVETPK